MCRHLRLAAHYLHELMPMAVAVSVSVSMAVRLQQRCLAFVLSVDGEHGDVLVARRGGRRNERGSGGCLDARGLVAVLGLVEPGGEEVEHERGERGGHGDEPGDREPPPRHGGEARAGQRGPGVVEHVDEPRGQDDPGGERLGRQERGAVRAHRAALPAHERKADAEHPGHQDRRHGHLLEPQRRGVVTAPRPLRTLLLHLVRAAHGRERRHHKLCAHAPRPCRLISTLG